MSRSYRKTPIVGITTCRSEKEDKRLANRVVRARNRQRMRVGLEPLDRRALTDPWSMGKDGKAWWGKAARFREFLRK